MGKRKRSNQQQQQQPSSSSSSMLSTVAKQLSKKSKMTSVVSPLTTSSSTTTSSKMGRNRSLSTNTTNNIPILFKNRSVLIIDKPFDVHLDGKNEKTVEKLINEQHSDMNEWLEDEIVDRRFKTERRKLKFCHQLDYSTSGVMCLAFTRESCARISTCFQFRTAQKWYLAVVLGHLHTNDLLCLNKNDNDNDDDDAATAVEPTETELETKKKKKKHGSSKEELLCRMQGVRVIRENSSGDGAEKESIQIETWIGNDLDDARGFRMRNWNKLDASVDSQAVMTAQEEKMKLSDARLGETNCTILNRGYYLVPMPVSEDQSQQGSADSNETTQTTQQTKFKRVPVTKVLLKPKTGRRHQLRLHMKHIGHAICGDATYAEDFEAHRMMLHAWRLTLPIDFNDQSYKRPTRYTNKGVNEQTPMITFETEDPFKGVLFKWDQ